MGGLDDLCTLNHVAVNGRVTILIIISLIL